VRTTSGQHGPYGWGYTHATMEPTEGLPSRKTELIPKTASQWGLGAATRPHERGIGSNRASAMAR